MVKMNERNHMMKEAYHSTIKTDICIKKVVYRYWFGRKEFYEI